MSQVTFKKREIIYRPYESVVKWIVDIVMIICIAYLMVLALAHKTTVQGDSMTSTLNQQDVVLINKIAYSFHGPNRYDIIVFESEAPENEDLYVKRVIALPGETVQIKEGKVYVDGKVLEDDVIDTEIYNAGLAADPIKLSYNEYFVLGDNRNNSDDSRFSNIGLIKSENIIGRPWFCISPIADMGFIGNSPKVLEEPTETETAP